ncbi:MAG TPA: hypothetical protein DDZ80_17035 [Cyanobacteria bacterium UBA8803]|nr:hypothetical protein [Cyanobacteria bacterium UBA9273]HBL60103.1 hypothetical protein [Cyanobacteria bacterium UBA8803]
MQSVARLELISMGWIDGFAIWRVRNVNDFDINFIWQLYETGQKGKGIALAQYDVFFRTILFDGSNTARIWANGIPQSLQKADLSQASYCSIEPLPEPLTCWRYFPIKRLKDSRIKESQKVS